MDKPKARKILTGKEKTNDLKNPGSLISDPSVVVTLVTNGAESPSSYGNFGLREDEIDYLVHRAKSVSLNQKEEYYENNEVIAKVFTLKNDQVVLKKYKADPEQGWTEI